MTEQNKWDDMDKKEKTAGLITLAVIGIIIFAIIGSLTSGSKQSASSSTTEPPAAQPAARSPQPSPPQDKNPHFTDGTYKVGSDIQPGTYRTRVASSGCYYERMRDFTGGFDSILANDNTDGPAIVTILPTDVGFTSNRCGTWTQDLSPIITSKTSFSEGTYIVGTDIQPGTYRSSGQDSCYWSRLADFTNGSSSIIANGNSATPTIVTITATDRGFSSKRCGTWTLQ
jgi:hypothetical protein